MLMTSERRPAIRTMRGWAIDLLQNVGAIRECEEHGWMQDRADSPYTSGRGNSWVKKTCAQRETLTIAGFALDEGKWDGIYVGRREGDELIHAGKVDHGFDKTSADLQKRLKPLIRKTQPYAKRIAQKCIWVEPKLLAEIEYRANQLKERSAPGRPYQTECVQCRYEADLPDGQFHLAILRDTTLFCGQRTVRPAWAVVYVNVGPKAPATAVNDAVPVARR